MNKIKKNILAIILIIVLAVSCFIIYEIATVHNTYYIVEKNLQIPILTYHDIVADESEVEYDYMQTTVNTFEKQITGLMKLGYMPISYNDLRQYNNGEKSIPKWSFMITFDDGYSGVYEYAYEIAKKYNIPMASFVIDDCVGSEGYYTWNQAKEMYDSGLMEIYSHGLTHVEYDKVSPEELVQLTNQAYVNLRDKLENDNLLQVFTYPYGLYTDEERALLANEGYIQNLTDNKINMTKTLDLSGLHRTYALDDSALRIFLKIQYRAIKYK